MKRTLILLGITAASMSAMAQRSALPFVEEGRVWRVLSLHPAAEPEPGTEGEYHKDRHGRWCTGTVYEEVLAGDTVMGRQTYKKLTSRGLSQTSASFVCGLRQDGNRIYMRFSGSDHESLIYDFGLSVGDVLPYKDFADNLYMKVEAVDYVTVNGVSRKRLRMGAVIEGEQDPYIENVDVWVEGIGCLSGPSTPTCWMRTSGEDLMECCYQGRMLLFAGSGFGAPWVTDGVGGTRSADGQADRGLRYDLSGRRLADQPQKGVYIRDGRKYVVK